MKQGLLALMMLLTQLQCTKAHGPSLSGQHRGDDDDIEALLAQMSVPEKVGQMTQLTMSMFVKDGASSFVNGLEALDGNKLSEAIGTYHVGSLFNFIRGGKDSSETAETWHRVIETLDRITAATSRLQIPILFGIDAVHGANYTRGAVLFPHAINLGATFDRKDVADVAQITARDVALSGMHWNFGPNLDVARQPLWGRVYETLGEQAWTVRTLGEQAVQAHAAVPGCAKHFAAYGASRTGKDRTPALLSEREMQELYLPPFEAAVRAGVPAIMVNSAAVDGSPLHAHPLWLTHWLRERWGFEGVVVSDYADIEHLFTRDKVATSLKDAIRLGVMAGVDMSMVPKDYSFPKLLGELVEEGAVPQARIDQAVRRILRLKKRAQRLTLAAASPARPDGKSLGNPDDHAVSLRVARHSMTLLKNERQMLPLKEGMRVLLTGPQADSLRALGGGWTYAWQGAHPTAYGDEGPTVLAAMQALGGRDKVRFEPLPDRAVARAKHSDVAVVCVGEQPYAEWFGNIDNLKLDHEQRRLIERLEATGVPVVVVLVEGRPRILRDVVESSRAILLAYLPGFKGGQAIAETLFGHNNPSGRLPWTYPRATGSLLLSDAPAAEYGAEGSLEVEWPLGHGLSYSSFEVEKLTVSKEVRVGDTVEVQVQVVNRGPRAGRHTVLLFVGDQVADKMRAKREVRGFETVELEPGQKQALTFRLSPYDLSYMVTGEQRRVDPGSFILEVGAASATFTLVGQPLTL